MLRDVSNEAHSFGLGFSGNNDGHDPQQKGSFFLFWQSAV